MARCVTRAGCKGLGVFGRARDGGTQTLPRGRCFIMPIPRTNAPNPPRCAFTSAEPSLFACTGGKTGRTPTVRCHNSTQLEHWWQRARAAGCPNVSFAVTLVTSANGRRRLFNRNKKLLPELRALPVVNASDKVATLADWRALGVPFNKLHASKPRSIGQFASHLTYVHALIRQVEHRVPFLLVLEDDVNLGNVKKAARFRKAACIAARQTAGRYPGRAPPGLVTLGTFSEAFLTSLDGARSLLYTYCSQGILNNKDFQNILLPAALKFSGGLGDTAYDCSFFGLQAAPGRGVISRLSKDLDLDVAALRAESISGPRGWCHRLIAART